jgi:ABC-2 type transport system ATP-binding protein
VDITVTNLTKVYRRRVHALSAVDLTVPTGMFGLLGANGAGKTTLMRILAGLLRPTAGTVRIGGYDPAVRADRAALKRGLGYLPQDLGVYPDLSAREFLDYVGLLKGLDDTRVRRRRVGELLELVGLTAEADRRLRGWSGGMRRRVGIAQALLGDPWLLIVDEPTAGLDPSERIRFRTLLAQLAGDRTVLLSTHIVEDVAQTCRRLAVLSGGRLTFHGTVPDLLDRARGRVWSVRAPAGEPPPPGLVVAAVADDTAMRYRVLSADRPTPAATPAEPSLEDGYMVLMSGQDVPGWGKMYG